MNMDKLEESVRQLGEKLVKCNLKCDGIKNDPNKFYIPRYVFLEKRDGHKTCIVVGLNPGKCPQDERDYYRKNGIKYDSIEGYFQENLQKPYFKRTRDLITGLGFEGDILWTNLAKCECKDQNGELPVQTLRVCINRFLRHEIELLSSSTIFALGNVSFNFCALRFPNHFVVGIPHPTGSHGNFHQLNTRIQKDLSRFKKIVTENKDGLGNYKAIKLSKIQ